MTDMTDNGTNLNSGTTPAVAPSGTTPTTETNTGVNPAPQPASTDVQPAPQSAPLDAPTQPAPVDKPADKEAPAQSGTKPGTTELKTPGDTLLGKTEIKPETKVEGEELSPKEGQSDEPAPPPPAYEPFKLPEGTTLEAEKVGKFTELLSKLETGGKADHAAVQSFGQEAVDFYINEVNQVKDTLVKQLNDGWEKQKNDWKEAFLKDPELGGNRWQTTITAAKDFIRTHGGTDKQQTEFRELMETSGLGNHPAMIRMLANANRMMGEGKPLAAPNPAPAPKSRTKTMYGNMTQV